VIFNATYYRPCPVLCHTNVHSDNSISAIAQALADSSRPKGTYKPYISVVFKDGDKVKQSKARARAGQPGSRGQHATLNCTSWLIGKQCQWLASSVVVALSYNVLLTMYCGVQNCVQLIIEDNGCGMTREVLEKCLR
jgi:hypothetical protein